MNTYLEIDSVVKSYDGRTILSDIYLKAICEVADTYMLLHEGYLRPIKELDELKGIYFI